MNSISVCIKAMPIGFLYVPSGKRIDSNEIIQKTLEIKRNLKKFQI